MRNLLQQTRMELLPRNPALLTPSFPDALTMNRNAGLGAHHIVLKATQALGFDQQLTLMSAPGISAE